MEPLEFLKSLNTAQREAVCHTGEPLLILAGAGSGKTRVITTKIAWLIENNYVSPEEILAVTFTNKAAKEMADRAIKLNSLSCKATIRTFHSFGAWLLRVYGRYINLADNFTIYDSTDSVSLLLKAVSTITKQEAKMYFEQISRAKDYCLTYDSPNLNHFFTSYYFAEMYEKYEKRLRETGNVDFGDLIMLPVLLLQQNEYVRQRLHNMFKVIMVDEYQDSNIAQFEFLKALTGENTYLCVVGDDDQSIYRFRGAEVKNILNFQNIFNGTKVIRLQENYRSFTEILDIANCIIQNNSGRLGKTLIAVRGSGCKPVFAQLPTHESEAGYCADLIHESIENGEMFSDWAILYRTNAQSRTFETHFLHENIPYKIVGSLKFYEREEIKDALAVLALVLNGKDEIAFRRIINKPSRSIGIKTEDKIIEFARSKIIGQNVDSLDTKNLEFDYSDPLETKDFISILTAELSNIQISKKSKNNLSEFLSVISDLRVRLKEGIKIYDESEIENIIKLKGNDLGAFIEFALHTTKFAEYHKSQDDALGTEKISNLQELLNIAGLYEYSITGLQNFLESIELDASLQAQNHADSENVVTLITVHNTKGLEFPNVIITGLEEKIFPIEDSGEELEEERRLMYVACTRAKNKLYMTACDKRMRYGSTSDMEPSRFLEEIDKSLIEVKDLSFNESHYSGQLKQKFGTDGFSKVIDHNSFSKTKIKNYNGWSKNTKVFSHDNGLGYVQSLENVDGEVVMKVKFQTGAVKIYIPKYSTGDLEIFE